MNNLKVAAALRLLADAFETPAEAAPAQPANSAPGTTETAPAKRGRGRPAKGEEVTTGSLATSPAAVEADPFETPAAPSVPPQPSKTLEDVRTALKALQAAKGQAFALQVLKDTGGGAANLADLKAHLFDAVVQAAWMAIPGPNAPPATPYPGDPFEVPAATPAAKPLTIEDVKNAVVAAQKRTSQDSVQKVVMANGGKAAKPEGGEGPSLKALPPEKFAATIAALNAMPDTKQ